MLFKKVFIFIFLSLFFLTSSAFAQEPVGVGAGTNPGGESVGVFINGKDQTSVNESNALEIDGNNLSVTIEFKGIKGLGDMWLCPLSDQTKCRLNPNNLRKTNENNGQIKITACGAGKDALKGEGENGVKIGKKCKDDGSDYFHEGHAYRLGLYDDKEAQAQIMIAEFYVRHSAPKIKIEPQGSGNFKTLKVSFSGRRPKGENKNNYQLVLEKTSNGEYKKEKCSTVNESGIKTLKLPKQEQSKEDILNASFEEANPASVTFGVGKEDPPSPLLPGDYTLKVNEQVNEGDAHFWDSCSGGYTYLHVFLNLDKSGKLTIKNVLYDPNESDAEKIRDTFLVPDAPCEQWDDKKDSCLKVRTSIGDISVTPTGFVSSLFSVILTIAGTGAFIIIVYSGYVFMTSRGDKEKVAAARDTLTSAILGLLFIIFSIIILETIGVDILKIPGLTR